MDGCVRLMKGRTKKPRSALKALGRIKEVAWLCETELKKTEVEGEGVQRRGKEDAGGDVKKKRR